MHNVLIKLVQELVLAMLVIKVVVLSVVVSSVDMICIGNLHVIGRSFALVYAKLHILFTGYRMIRFDSDKDISMFIL